MVADQSRPAIDFGLELERMTPAARRLLSAVDFAGRKRITFDFWWSLVSVLEKKTHG